MSLTVERTSPTTLTVTRRFRASPARVFAAHTDQALVARWLGGEGYGGYAMPVCEFDARPGGSFRYEFANAGTGHSFAITGDFDVVEAPSPGGIGRTVHRETMHMPERTPINLVETLFAPDGDGTLLTMTMTLPDAASVDAMVATGMTDGMEYSYGRLDSALAA